MTTLSNAGTIPPELSPEPKPRRRRANSGATTSADRAVLSPADRRSPRVRFWFGLLTVVILSGLVVVCLGPLLWLSKAAVSTSQGILRDPLKLVPAGGAVWSNFKAAWTGMRVGTSIGNSVIVSVGNIVVNLVVCVTLAYVLSVLRPRWGKVLGSMVLATLFIPGVVILVPMYLTVLNLPLFNISLLNTYWGYWLPVSASPFNVLVVKRFFDGIPRDLFEAAKVDGAGPWRVLFSIVLPLSRPILSVIAVFAGFYAWKDFLWPKLVLAAKNLQPISVALDEMSRQADLGIQMAAVFLGLIFPLVVFIIFQKQFLAGVAMSGGVKG